MIHRTCLLFLLSMGISIPVSGQKLRNTEFIVVSGDTLFGQVEYKDEDRINPRFYKKIRFTPKDGKRKKFKWALVDAFMSDGEYYEGFNLSQTTRGITLVNPYYDIDDYHGERYFLRLIDEGTLSHYKMEWWNQGEADLMDMSLLKKENDSFFVRADQGLLGLKNKTLAKYFSDCPNLQQQIESNKVKKVQEVVNYYNTNCEVNP